MANGHGGKRVGAGRRVGSGDKPHIRDYWTDHQIKKFYESLFERALKSDRLAAFVGEQLSGKALQPLAALTADQSSSLASRLECAADSVWPSRYSSTLR